MFPGEAVNLTSPSTLSACGNADCATSGSDHYKALTDYAHAYWDVHPYISLIICVFGILTNILNICVLRQEKMRTPINLILIGIAISDIITMADYVPFAFHFYILTDLSKYKRT